MKRLSEQNIVNFGTKIKKLVNRSHETIKTSVWQKPHHLDKVVGYRMEKKTLTNYMSKRGLRSKVNREIKR